MSRSRQSSESVRPPPALSPIMTIRLGSTGLCEAPAGGLMRYRYPANASCSAHGKGYLVRRLVSVERFHKIGQPTAEPVDT
jgi:hypothetical protein